MPRPNNQLSQTDSPAPQGPGTPQLEVSLGQYSDAGPKELNQDFHGAMLPEGAERESKGIALAIADGISTSPVSGVAAESAVKSFLSDYYCTPDAWTVKTAGSKVIAATNAWLFGETSRSKDKSDMNRGYVCTFSAMVVKGRRAHIFHVGDSRVWRLSGQSLEQLTEDHRMVLSSHEGYLQRALGMAHGVDIDYLDVELAEGDVFVLTTDGIHDFVTPRDMAAAITAEPDLEKVARQLLAQALENQSSDNLTLQILRIDRLPEREGLDVLEQADSLPVPPVPHVPSDFEGYRLLRRIHGNNRSHIYLATDTRTGQQVAVKLPSTDMQDVSGYLRRFLMEEWIARRIDSPHVLKAAPRHENRDYLYVATEFVDGVTLRQWMHDHPLADLDAVRNIVDQVARGLRAFHRMEMLHQDIRPENIMIDREGTVKIIDFGSTRVAGVLETVPELYEGQVLGMQQYAAPEYFLGYAGDERSDLFSLAVVAYEMLTGRLPYGAAVARATTAKAQAALTMTPADRMGEPIPRWVEAALAKALHPDPTQRYQVLSEFTTDLRRPNPKFVPDRFVPLAKRNPVMFWQLLSFALGVALVIALASS